ncbi:hypothetical protein W97_05457 [Coniosporium apollinis CBS 100218]|uniref:Uncharacterized protein n=1 Tax=Coniosporium apollinis (strain CBS 100218) TaxID=1168221 RepID=R7YWP8_CONA1|nr:uncharacterized protein W97_05457 [Coniosporium apollinis CBS 100218]EON66360.1 hypothetical protein W97_05457 [Coniosporium apollinis CBS 100218]
MGQVIRAAMVSASEIIGKRIAVEATGSHRQCLQRPSKDAVAEAKLAEAKSKLAAAGGQLLNADNSAITEKDLASVVEDDEAAGQLARAIDKTDALQQDEVWHFFQDGDTRPAERTFPNKSLPPEPWAMMLKSPETREQAFTSGCVQMIAATKALPEELMIWMMDELLYQTREDLTHAYLRALQSCGTRASACLTPSRLYQLFRDLGAKQEAINSSGSLTPSRQSDDTLNPPLPSGLRWVLDLLRILATSFTDETRSAALSIALRLCFDISVLADGRIQHSVQEAISALIDSIPGTLAEETLHSVALSIFTTLKPPILRLRLATALPTHSPRQAKLARRLALASFMNDPRFLTYSLIEPKLSCTVTRYLLKSRSFRIDRKTDYLALAAKIDLLDLALGTGFSDFNFFGLSAAPSTTGQATRMKRDPESKAAEATFNADVDALEQQLKLIENMIVSAGAEYLNKIQAKNSIERLCSRLRNTVRTVEWSGEDVFAGSVGSSAVMQRWVGRGRGRDVDGGGEAGREAKRKWDAVDGVEEVRGLKGVIGAV